MAFKLGDQSRLAQILYMRKMQERGFLESGHHYLMLAHDEEKIAALISAADESLGEISNVIEEGDLAEIVKNPPPHIGFARLT